MEFSAFILGKWITQHLLMREGEHDIYSREMGYTAFTHERWCPHLLKIVGVHSNFF